MKTYAYYRLPYADHYIAIASDSEPQVLSDISEIGAQIGFVIAPFDDGRIVLINASNMTSVGVNDERPCADGNVTNNAKDDGSEYGDYQTTFGRFHDAVSDGRYGKLVLARKKTIAGIAVDAKAAFLRACRMYPRLMIMLFSTPQTGTWLIASPEILVEQQHGMLHTIALAGTMPYEEGYVEWSEKNKAEQHIVEQYIGETLSDMCHNILKDGPVTMRAGDLVHLRTDFRCKLNDGVIIGQLLKRLHPTPAVCGLPKDEARAFIHDNENLDRRYYSGFAGPVGINDETHLYVSLRCAEISADGSQAALYAGGGIMPDSTCLAEWQETENKMQTINNVLQ